MLAYSDSEVKGKMGDPTNRTNNQDAEAKKRGGTSQGGGVALAVELC